MLPIREGAIVIATAVAAYTDHKTGFIYDYITYPLIALGIILNVWEQNWLGLALGAIVFVLGYALYYLGKVGGGDIKLFAGIATTLPSYDGGIFIISAGILAALGAMVFLSAYYCVKYLRENGIEYDYNREGIKRAIFLLLIITAYFSVLLGTGFVSKEYVAAFALPLLLGTIFLALEKGIRKKFFLKKILVKDVEEDEIVAFEFMPPEQAKKIRENLKGIIGPKEASKLSKMGIREMMVYRDLPRFGVFIFLGVVMALLFPGFGEFLAGGGL
ncbi:MAG: A24 family peptidase [archaeon]|nr:A24 family peptidase [archaeon]